MRWVTRATSAATTKSSCAGRCMPNRRAACEAHGPGPIHLHAARARALAASTRPRSPHSPAPKVCADDGPHCGHLEELAPRHGLVVSALRLCVRKTSCGVQQERGQGRKAWRCAGVEACSTLDREERGNERVGACLLPSPQHGLAPPSPSDSASSCAAMPASGSSGFTSGQNAHHTMPMAANA